MYASLEINFFPGPSVIAELLSVESCSMDCLVSRKLGYLVRELLEKLLLKKKINFFFSHIIF